ncbi:hypothetical protein AB0L75_41885 [Streptomyces sp. NPDC052101]|uniref:hypothetical protein n=1 Tax=Streptomyces sp. NPDC052101 TaxID=3155763 RepID=UPI00343A0C3D
MSTAQPNRRRPARRAWNPDLRAIWALLILVLVLVVLSFGAGLVYVTWRHPSLGTPLTVALAGVTLLATIAIALTRR